MRVRFPLSAPVIVNIIKIYMHPILFSFGPINLRVFNLFLVLGFFISAFIFWRRTKEEYYPEDELFDGFLLATVFGLVAGRAGFILSHLNEFAHYPNHWVNIFAFPGFLGLVGLLTATLYLAFFAQQKKWDVFEILDYWVTSLTLGASLTYFGLFFDGSGNGLTTSLPWGVIFPGQAQPHHPIQLYWAIYFFLMFIYLSWVEYRYRTFIWYRAGKKVARTGFLTASFLISLGLFSFLINFITSPQFVFYQWRLDFYLAILIFFSGFGLILIRSGKLSFKKKRRPYFYDKKAA